MNIKILLFSTIPSILTSTLIGEFATRAVYNHMIAMIENGKVVGDALVLAIATSFIFRPILTGLFAVIFLFLCHYFLSRKMLDLNNKTLLMVSIVAIISATISFLYAYYEITKLGRFWP